ncbi:MAG: transglutaminase-like domain-containing protein [bacterium]
MNDWSTPRRRYAALVDCADDDIPLAHAAASIALVAYPDLDVDAVVGELAALATRVRGHIGSTEAPRAQRAALERVLFAELGLRGNTEDYYDPRNSFLNDVLARRLGIPISLSVVYITLGRMVGLALEGVGFPGHFLVRVVLGPGESVLVDPFGQGRDVSDADLRALLAQMGGAETQLPSRYLARASTRDILARMLGNLRGVYAGRGDAMKTLEVMEWLVLTQPENPMLKRDRGLLYHRLGSHEAAAQDLRAYLRGTPEAEDRAAIEHIIRRGAKARPTIH